LVELCAGWLIVTERELADRARLLDKPGLADLWSAVKANNTPGWAKGKAFEYLIVRAFELEGAKVTYPYRVAEDAVPEAEQFDGVVYDQGMAFFVEAKHYHSPTNFEPAAKLSTQLRRRPGVCLGMLFSTSGFTRPAKELARHLAPYTVLLWEPDEIEYALLEIGMLEGLRRKYRGAVEHARPNWPIMEEPPADPGAEDS
jgi:hypothetical protein